MKKKSTILKITTSLMCSAVLFACSNNSDTETESTAAVTDVKVESLGTIGNADISTVVAGLVSYSADDEYTSWTNENPTYINLSGTSATVEGGSGAAVVSGGVITIKSGGVYVISGTLSDGQIVVEAEDKSTVRLVLNGAEITSSTSAPIYVKDAEKTVISLEEGTENVLTDGTNHELNEEEEPSAALYSKDTLTINGEGKLIVNANYKDGIVGKDELRITSGNIEVHSVDDAIVGRDLLAVKAGSFTLEAGGDGLKSTNDTDADKGIIALQGGTFDIDSTNDGVQAVSSLYVTDGTYTITTGGGSPETIAVSNDMGGRGGQSQSTTTTTTETESAKGLKAQVELAIGGGTFTIDSSDDAIHSNASVTIAGGEFDIMSGDDGVHADTAVAIKDGKINVTKAAEGIEGTQIAIAGGEHHLTTSDDGVNVSGGADSSSPDMTSTASSDSVLSISGGTLTVNAEGDGLDSNGSMVISGGTIMVNGPTNAGNGALDYNGTFDMNGGTLIAAGSSGMLQASSDNSKQAAVLMMFSSTQAAGTVVSLADGDGNVIATVAPEKSFGAVYFSTADMKKGSTYTVYTGGEATGTVTGGLYTDGEYSGGTKVVEFTADDLVTWVNESGVTEAQEGMMGGHGMGGGGGRGMKPTDGQMPSGDSTTDSNQ